ncbi:MAG: hypothetical protein ACYTF5_21995, partial [Planctomycetota bacterium]
LVLFRCLENFDRLAILKDRGATIHNWIWRWACDEKAGPADRDVLLKLLESDNELAWSIAVHGLAAFVDAASQKKLGARGDSTKDINLSLAILWAFARRGELRHSVQDTRTRNLVARQAAVGDGRLRLWSEASALGLGLYWQLHLKKGGSRFRELLFYPDADRPKVALDLCTGDRYEFALAGLRVRPEWFQRLATEVPDRDLPGRYLARVVMHVPGYRRVDLARRALRQADLKKPTDKSVWTGALDDFLAFLEVTAP